MGGAHKGLVSAVRDLTPDSVANVSFDGLTSSSPPLEDMSGVSKSMLIFLPQIGSGKENNVFPCGFELFVLLLPMEIVLYYIEI